MKWFLSKLDCQDKENADYDNEEHVDEVGYAQRPLFDCDDEDGDNNEVDHGKKEHAKYRDDDDTDANFETDPTFNRRSGFIARE